MDSQQPGNQFPPIQTQPDPVPSNQQPQSYPENTAHPKSKFPKIIIIVIVVIIGLGYLIPFLAWPIVMGLIQAQLPGTKIDYRPMSSGPPIVGVESTSSKGDTYQSGTFAKLPADFPTDFPIYPNSNLIYAQTSSDGSYEQVGFQTQETDPSKIINFLVTNLQENGWAGYDRASGKSVSTEKMTYSSSKTIYTLKKDNRLLDVALGTSENKVSFGVVYTKI